ncbi:Hypothetical protein ORPV_169 [Orpheovirus IHUMI-LCC2]|uniref:Uncharacterized protein n=1 Tax=Orpheovirus IHUMI-LCC2 TaxID=2023057 RepID=A0A2I2L3H2_9VIRU|nr:Hypothetical protein ORPV_169 [Orpheovirus IHUMI-LCC2]SNW62073.1 Hypothetical protein ORPV_169 [Orpheovirus IHUMI-LCC2]
MSCNSGIVVDLLNTMKDTLDITSLSNILSSNHFLLDNMETSNFWMQCNDLSHDWILELLKKDKYTAIELKISHLLYKYHGFVFHNYEEYINTNKDILKTNENLKLLFNIYVTPTFYNDDDEDEDGMSVHILFGDSDTSKVGYNKKEIKDDKIVWPFNKLIVKLGGSTYISTKKDGFNLMNILEVFGKVLSMGMTFSGSYDTIEEDYKKFTNDNAEIPYTSENDIYPDFMIVGVEYNISQNAWTYLDWLD